MPELPEVETLVLEMRTKLLGKRIKSIEIRTKKIFQGNKNVLISKRISEIKRRAKVILMHIGKYWIMIHLKLTGQLFYLPSGKDKTKTGEQIGKHTHVIINFTDGSRLFFNEMRKFGYMKVLNDENLLNFIAKSFGPEPFDRIFTLKHFKVMLEKRKGGRIKQVLMDQKFIAGIGNIYSDEALFLARINPVRRIKSLTNSEIELLYKAIKKVLLRALRYQGSSIQNYRRLSGELGHYGEHRYVYGREGEKCFGCPGKVKRIKIGGRSAHFCPSCQKLK